MKINFFKKIWIEIKKPNNIAKYIVYFLIALFITAIFQYCITPHPKIKVTSEPTEVDAYRIRIKNTGNKATEDLQFRVFYIQGCILGIDSIELEYLNDSKKDFSGSYYDTPYSKKWLITGVELNPGVEFSFICQKEFPFQIRISGSNFAEVVKTNKP